MIHRTAISVLYNFTSSAEILLALLSIKRFVYLEPILKRKKIKIVYLAAFMLTAGMGQMIPGAGEGVAAFIPAAFFCIHIILTRKKHRISGICLIVPVMGFLIALLALFYAVPYTLTGKYPSGNGWTHVIDGIFWSVAGILYWKRSKINHLLRLDAPYRKLGRWERNFLHISGIFLLITGCMMIAVKETGMEEGASRVFTGFGSFAVLLLEISVIILIQQENKKNYFQYMTTIGEHYLKTELNHFRAYQEREEKIRRFRHDMKNHFICLNELAGRGDLESVKQYIRELQEGMGETMIDFNTGNEIADAILNEKNMLARAENIEIKLYGKMPSHTCMMATDICTIFSNALDNALEALGRQNKEKSKWISIEIKQHNGLLSLIFRNPVCDDVLVTPGNTEKVEKEEHGLGILNMIYTAEKYSGSLHRWIEEKDGNRIYSLEIFLFLSRPSD